MSPETSKDIDRATAWLDRAMLRQAKTIGAHRGQSISEVLERHLRGPLARESAEVAAEMAGAHDTGNPIA